jgi:Domain of unknown function (DUF4292)
MYKIVSLLLILTLFSCKSKQKVITPTDIATTVSDETVSNIIKNHYAVKRDFKTAYIKAGVDYEDPKQSLSLSADIRIKKDEVILVSAKFLGITMAKAIITPTQVRYYEKMGGKYFDGDFKTLSNWLGTDLDFAKVQNMLLGQTIDDLSKAKYNVVNEENSPKLEEISAENFSKAFVFLPDTFLLKRQEITQKTPQRKLLVNYPNYKTYQECIIPAELLIFANQNNQTTNITIEYKNATFNEEMTFPYSVPSGYEQIKINNN